VRELRNVIEQAVMLAAGDIIEPRELMLSSAASNPPSDTSLLPYPPGEAGSALDRRERELLVQAMTNANHNVSQAARTLGISRDTLRYRLEKHGLKE
jgi:DNA-binding NtrC family response regulator